MSSSNRDLLQPRRPRGFVDSPANRVLARTRMISVIRRVYELYGFSPLETPAVEYLDALGKYLPSEDAPAGGVLAFRGDGKEWLALRYDLTAPLARFYSEHIESRKPIIKPFRRYQVGPVWRNEKPEEARLREFYQFDIDTVGTSSMAADAEVCCILADVMKALFNEFNVTRGRYVVRVNNRKALTGVLKNAGVPTEGETFLAVLRHIDKHERLGIEGVSDLLREGRRDESGAFIKGAQLNEHQVESIVKLLLLKSHTRSEMCDKLFELVRGSDAGEEGVKELREIDEFLGAAGVSEQTVIFDPTVVRGLTYYTGPVFEVTLFIKNEGGQEVKFGIVAGGGRYDDLVKRFLGEEEPATGASIGVDRLLIGLKNIAESPLPDTTPPVIVIATDEKYKLEYQKITTKLRQDGIPAEMYLGKERGIGAQLKYANDRGSIIAIIAGSEEFEAGNVKIKNLILGRERSKDIALREEWIKDQSAQVVVKRDDLVKEVRRILQR